MITYDTIAERTGNPAGGQDWEEAFKYARGAHSMPDVRDIDDVLGGYNESTGSWAERNLLLVARMRDGTYLALTAYCDTTGWGCQDSVTARFAPTLDRLWEKCLGNEERARLDLEELRRRDGATLTGMIHERRRDEEHT